MLNQKTTSPQNVPKHGASRHFKKGKKYDKDFIYLSRHHSGYAVHLRIKRGRTGQIAAVERVSYYGFTTIGGVNIKGVEMST